MDSFLFYGGRSTGGGATDTVSNDLRVFERGRRLWDADEEVAGVARARAYASGHYCPCTGEFFVFGGLDARLDSTLAAIRDDGFMIPIEERVAVEWAINLQETRAHLEGRLSSPLLAQCEPESLELWDCQEETKLNELLTWQRDANGCFTVDSDSLSPAARSAYARGALVVTGLCVASGRRFLGTTDHGPRVTGTDRVRTYPSPSFGSAVVVLEVPSSEASSSLAIYDLAGKLIRRLTACGLSAGKNRAIWDRTDSNGNRVAKGVYFVRKTGEGRGATGEVILL
jgi:hypothetical protein